jgi:co-chaperonin GroES (HSP10)
MHIRPLHDWIIVKALPFEKKSSIIELPTNETNVRKGVVLAVGPKVTDLQVGEQVCYIRWHEEHRPGKQTMQAIREYSDEVQGDVATLRVMDILFVYEGDVKVDV